MPLPSKAARVCVYFLIQTNHQLVNWSLSYLVNLLVIFCCLELSHLIKTLTKKVGRSFGNELFETYEDLFETILMTEDTLSLICFICLMRLFMEFFRVFSLLFNFVRGKPQSASAIDAGTYGVVTGALFVAMIFAADSVQKNFQELQRRLMKKSALNRSTQNGFCFREQILVRNEDAILTGWGIFELKKKLFLSTLASLITYGVLLQQLQQ
ncbi:hypothetical protein AVEN_82653-1 [Araneus ventricosus]|uniref:Uncharacterized protein n=1 Tax=Araneus ventricosus TaxID=182803 RepID=A0A4Y2LLA3_ARAVE|nr:hypothetical protein AVEN_82653-1 [Araneus ventricosus]